MDIIKKTEKTTGVGKKVQEENPRGNATAVGKDMVATHSETASDPQSPLWESIQGREPGVLKRFLPSQVQSSHIHNRMDGWMDGWRNCATHL